MRSMLIIANSPLPLLCLPEADGFFQLLAMKDMYVLYKTIEEEYQALGWGHGSEQGARRGHKTASPGFSKRFLELFTTRRLRNALISSSTVNLAQQLCGSKFPSAFHPIFSALYSVIVSPLTIATVLSQYSGILLGDSLSHHRSGV